MSTALLILLNNEALFVSISTHSIFYSYNVLTKTYLKNIHVSLKPDLSGKKSYKYCKTKPAIYFEYKVSLRTFQM